MQFPEWTPELETEVRRAYHNAPAAPGVGGSRHTGLKAVYDLLKGKAIELEAQKQAEALKEAQRREYLATMNSGPWDDAADWERTMSRNDVGIPPDPFM